MRNSSKILIGTGVVAATVAALVGFRLMRRHPVGNAHVPEPAKAVDLQRYLGRWFEVARYDQRFERGCKAAMADYSLRPDGMIDVVNRCRKLDGTLKQAHGIAKIVDVQSKAKLKVSFFGPFYGDYWILDRADDYSWSIVGEPSGRYLWILSRDPHLADAQLRGLVSRATAMGYDTSMLLLDQHS